MPPKDKGTSETPDTKTKETKTKEPMTFAHMIAEGTSHQFGKDDPDTSGQSSEAGPTKEDPGAKEAAPASEQARETAEKAGTSEGETEGAGKKAGEAEPKQYRFKTQEEAEKAYEEAQRLMTRATTRTREIERQLTAAQKTLKEDDQKVLAKLTAEATKKIRGIPQDDPELEAKQLEILSELQANIAAHTSESTAKRIFAEQIKQREEMEAANTIIHNRLAEHELDTPAHFDLFIQLLRQTMDEHGEQEFNALDETKQFELVFSRMKPLIGFTEERLKKISEKNDEVRKSAAAMGRGGTSLPERETSAPTTLKAQFQELKDDKARAFRG